MLRIVKARAACYACVCDVTARCIEESRLGAQVTGRGHMSYPPIPNTQGASGDTSHDPLIRECTFCEALHSSKNIGYVI